MLELTLEQVRAIGLTEPRPTTLIDPVTRKEYVLLRREEYERFVDEVDDGPWTAEEMDLLAVEAGDMLDSFGKEA